MRNKNNKNMEAKVISVVNEKGGTAKTSDSFLITGELVHKGYKVLLIDFDPSAMQTKLMGLDKKDYLGENPHSIANIYENKPIKPITLFENLDFIPANDDLTSKAHNPSIPGKDITLKKYIKSVRANYDYIIIDGPPLDTVLINNIVMAGDIILIPVATSSLEGMATPVFLEKIDTVFQTYETSPQRICFLPSRFSHNKRKDNDLLKALQTDAIEFAKSLGSFENVEVNCLNAIPERTSLDAAIAGGMFFRNFLEEWFKEEKVNPDAQEKQFEILRTIENIVDDLTK